MRNRAADMQNYRMLSEQDAMARSGAVIPSGKLGPLTIDDLDILDWDWGGDGDWDLNIRRYGGDLVSLEYGVCWHRAFETQD